MKLFRKSFQFFKGLRKEVPRDPFDHFTSYNLQTQKIKDKKGEEQEVFNFGRSWTQDELRIKSNEDLHKLWYVLLREKNSILSDNKLSIRATGDPQPPFRMERVERSMRRIWKVLDERKKVRENYRRHLEDEYTLQKKQEFKEANKKKEIEEELQPEITQELLQRKYKELKKGRDNLDYLELYVLRQKAKKQMKNYLRQQYDYKNKKIVDPSKLSQEEMEKLDKEKTLFTFKNQIEEQIKKGVQRISQEEVLRSHIKNWKNLDLKQRRIVTNCLNARRARDAKKEFTKELNLLAQKIAYENKQMENLLENQLFWFI